ncbi:cytotoxic necrotizing factor Rho-activating domain-containing protein [Proteus sp. CD3]|uniref:cytotoxic necrotizing factor Rho-activating domain-containing protein n=1 Tax=Proteus sp. CD3 TaxID=1921565 RepID=UPI00129F4FCD|nr:cytotoxic necrotizing factor Rho-activating domain-containing protein [Proteus sp. CD3]QEZ93479.1 hypothetical protein BTA34_14530 [Proteus sp. CD3]
MLNQQLHTSTPTVVVLDNRGSTIREINYCRHPDTINKTDERITRHYYHARGYLERSIDARLYKTQQSDASIQANIQQVVSLGGLLSATKSVDSGNSVNISDIENKKVMDINGLGLVTEYHYTKPEFVSQLMAIMESSPTSKQILKERFTWGGADNKNIANNSVGKCTHHDFPAGRTEYGAYALTGQHLIELRFITANTVKTPAHSQYQTRNIYDATGQLLKQIDAAGHEREWKYDRAGFLNQSSVQLQSDKKQLVIKAIDYSAAGQKLRVEHGNGLVTTYEYEAETQRLLHVKTQRPQGHVLGAKIMQDLRYEYDPVGNIICLKNDAEATRYWRNQKVVPENRYVYDSLYQLVSATGRESANQKTPASMQSQLVTTLVKDAQSYTNYTRLYAYDRGGNLTQIRHNSAIAQQSFTQNISVSNKTNRALLETQQVAIEQIDQQFDALGNQKHLSTGDALQWDLRGTLAQVNKSGNSEHYVYASASQRLIKQQVQRLSGRQIITETHYLPNLEIWQSTEGGHLTEHREVVDITGNVRALCWKVGFPKGIKNNQLRYSYDDGVGNSGLETDGQGQLVSYEEYYPYGGTAIWFSQNAVEANYKTIRYSGKEKDATGLYYYGYRYYQPWIGRWLSADPAGTVDGLNLYRMVRNNSVTLRDPDGRMPSSSFSLFFSSDDTKLQKGSITPLRNRGLFVGSNNESAEATLPFVINRFDSVGHNPVVREYSPQLLQEGGNFYNAVHIFYGSKVTSNEYGSGTIGTYWGHKTLSDNLTAIKVMSGMSGSVGISIRLNDIKEGKPLVITSGALSGCTMLYAVDKEKFYALHTGQRPGDNNWKTGIQGVKTAQTSLNALSGKNLSVSGDHNNDLIGTLSEFENSAITYLGKQGTKIDHVQENVAAFDYNLEAKLPSFSGRAGYSYALLAKNSGKVNVKVLSEDVTIDMKTNKISVLNSMKTRLH